MADRSSNVDFDDCRECAEEIGSGICANCGADGGFCPRESPGCGGSGRCCFCEGTGRRPIEPDPEYVAEVEAAGPLVEPEMDPGARDG